jgi:hypothetical protein
MPLGGESTCTVVSLPNCAMTDGVARTTGCGGGGGVTTGAMLGMNVGSGPAGDAGALGDGADCGDSMGDGATCGDALGSTGARSSGCATVRGCRVATSARGPEVPKAAAPMMLAAATMQHERRRRPSTYAIA